MMPKTISGAIADMADAIEGDLVALANEVHPEGQDGDGKVVRRLTVS
jgi:hypothetical protein